jgi:hypothetical protein
MTLKTLSDIFEQYRDESLIKNFSWLNEFDLDKDELEERQREVAHICGHFWDDMRIAAREWVKELEKESILGGKVADYWYPCLWITHFFNLDEEKPE